MMQFRNAIVRQTLDVTAAESRVVGRYRSARRSRTRSAGADMPSLLRHVGSAFSAGVVRKARQMRDDGQWRARRGDAGSDEPSENQSCAARTQVDLLQLACPARGGMTRPEGA